MACQFCYASNRISAPPAPPSANGAIPPSDASIQALSEPRNPLFNFPLDFIQKYQSVSTQDLALAVPYISLAAISRAGAVLQDFNLSFFSRGADLSALRSSARHSDRPAMSLVDVRIATDLSSGTQYYQTVSITLKLHKPDDRASNALVSILYPGGIFRLVYGWNSITGGNSFLNQKETLFFSVRDYTIDFDITGQAELIVEGLALSDILSNIMAGDRGAATAAVPEDLVTERQVDGIKAQDDKRAVAESNTAQPARQGTNALDAKKLIAKSDQPLSERACKAIRDEFGRCMAQLEERKQTAQDLFREPTLRIRDRRVTGQYVLLHDVIKTLCGPSLDALHGPYVPTNAQFRFVYGACNGSLRTYANKSLADFPIHWNSFKRLLRETRHAGGAIPTLRALINMLIENFLNDETYWRNHLHAIRPDAPGAPPSDPPPPLNLPIVTFHITTHSAGNAVITQLLLMDERKDVPITQQLLDHLNRPRATEDEIVRTVAGNMPIIRIGHANSFVKSINVSHVNDENMRAVFINRALQGTVTPARVPATTATKIASQKEEPFVLPLEGEMEVIGHIDWRPMRFFYLRSGIYLLDGVYKVTRVEHHLEAGAFSTTVGFTYH